MYTGVNDIKRLDRGPGSNLGDTLLAASLKALTMDQPSAELMMPTVGYEPLSVNQVVRTVLLVIIPTLDDINIALVQRGDQSCGVVILGPDSPGGAAGGHGHGGLPVGGDLAGSCSGTRRAVEGASLVVPLPLAVLAPRPLARANRRVPSLMTMRYCLMRMSLCRSSCGNSPAPGRRCSMRRPRLTRRTRRSGPWRRPRRRGLQRRRPQRRLR
jgi:hypothetical protein